jgi:hypothetical protein
VERRPEHASVSTSPVWIDQFRTAIAMEERAVAAPTIAPSLPRRCQPADSDHFRIPARWERAAWFAGF